ncbi:MAG: hypothetical protein DCC67_15210 [Planctomycetota bacterium]|nr:MAG: hypothetical protein DCC67_15210 [Planctomycetota bacterium]
MNDPHDADQQRLEEIVAYLDGELPPEAGERVERLLASDEAYRRQLQSIERAWQALDELPLTTVDDRFSRTTMEMAVQAAQAELQERTQSLPIVQRRARLSTALAALTAAALGFLVVRLAWRQPDRALLADLPVIDNVDVYSQFEDVEFLRRLHQELGGQLDLLAGKSDDLEQRVSRFQATLQAGSRDAWLRQLEDAERTSLRAKYYRFRDLPDPEQQRLRQLHQDVVGAPDAAQLQRTMLAYHTWLSGLPQALQFELRTTGDVGQRVRKVVQWAEQMREDALLALSEEELRAFAAAVRKPMEEFWRESGDRSPPGRPGGRGPSPRRGPLAVWQFALENMDRFEAAIVAALPPRAREPFEQLPPALKLQQFGAWMRQAEAQGRGQVSQQELERFFAEELDAETRESLLALPPEQMQQAVEWRYRRQTGLGPDWPRRGGFDGRGDGPGPPGGPDDMRPRGPGPGREFKGGFGRPGDFGPRGGFGSPEGPPWSRRPDDGPPPGPQGPPFSRPAEPAPDPARAPEPPLDE